ncbi:Altered inheritance of mitochondria protein 24, mitochondrial Precursor [Rasamsonia emersonii CBS 393.64]|uniref:Altered inheritance of mitochondria protein 24, mitochondrial n=1 Tax=Rasamsonia emersonii (strain ATCC 16479 / CBS 393.64 / IMI 116815) TaxID=1408163 RepID=A0A0F4YZF7_RASE3|nr:Altered inheritance of mitochondria protein 24, mitochondrial Precursor [Rasamsonia emersonii CBS 393.64]KKA23028.1 Altered inheritance of mitochondria protein 24, mitochondrial Precursor [Rasamsonia emersonii CBS 393.64]
MALIYRSPILRTALHLPVNDFRRLPSSLVFPLTGSDPLDAKFDVIGAPYSMLSVSLSASQNLYTRRGTLVGLSGKADNISSASPVTALISVQSPVTSFAVVHLNGTVDWMVAQRRALLAWTGHSLFIRPTVNTNLVTGRGLLALVGNGQIYSVELKAGEQYVAHPSNVIAYTITSNPPRPYRFKSTSLRFQVPEVRLPEIFARSRFIRDMTASDTWKTSMKILHTIRTWARRTIWGDRLFLQFEGPATILVQSRAARVRDVLSDREVNEIADAPAGATYNALNRAEDKIQPDRKSDYQVAAEEAVSEAPVLSRSVEQLTNEIKGTKQSIATVRDGKVVFEEPGSTTQEAKETR